MKKLKPTFPWARLMKLGLGTLKLSPSEFWHSTPREIAAAFGTPSQPMLRQKLNEMMERFPDE
jgi:uncharacterized phage protein (TIGR02216 family)